MAEIDSLYSIDLFGNAFTGAIPIELGNAENLNSLDLRSNQLTGTVPEFLCEFDDVDLNNNQLCGPYPSCLTAGELGTKTNQIANRPRGSFMAKNAALFRIFTLCLLATSLFSEGCDCGEVYPPARSAVALRGGNQLW